MRETAKQETQASSPLYVLSLDPGFAWLGYAVINIKNPATIVEMGLLRTRKGSKKLKVKQADDTFQRVGELAEALHTLILSYRTKALCFEAFSPPRSASVTGKMGHVYGVIACLALIHDIPVLSATPSEVRHAVGASRQSKDEVKPSVRAMYKETSLTEICRFERAWKTNEAEQNHAWDAVAVYEAVRRSEVIRALRSK